MKIMAAAKRNLPFDTINPPKNLTRWTRAVYANDRVNPSNTP